jgi:flagellar export protein FliJ
MKAFRFTLEAVRTLRQRQEQEALETYARALLARQQMLDLLEDMDYASGAILRRCEQLMAGRCTAAQAAQARNFHSLLEKKREDCLAALGQAERRVNAASQAMLAARQQREMVDVYREKQQAAHQRLESREEQKILDEFAIRRVTALNSAQADNHHE